MSEMVAWLGARLDELEAVAKAATPGPWEPHERHGFDFTGEGFSQVTVWAEPRTGDDVETIAFTADSGWDGADEAIENAAHIATHDPAAVLALVAGLRETAEFCVGLVDIADNEPRGYEGITAAANMAEEVLGRLATGLGWTAETEAGDAR